MKSARLLLAVALASSACHDERSATHPAGRTVASADARPLASAPRPPAYDPSTFALTLVAVTGGLADLRVWDKTRVFVDAGVFLYEARDEGLVRLGDAKAYAHDAFGDDLVGLRVRAPMRMSGYRRMELRGERLLVAEGDVVRSWDGSRWTVATDVALKTVSRDRLDEGYLRDESPPPDAGLQPKGCRLVLSADDGTYATCENAPFAVMDVSAAAPANGWIGRPIVERRTFLDHVAGARLAVARDGALWFAEEPPLRRATPDGSVSVVDVPAARPELWYPTFRGQRPEMMSAVLAHTAKGLEYWQDTHLTPAPTTRSRRGGIVGLVPKRDGTVWVALAQSGEGPTEIYRWGPLPAKPTMPLHVGSDFDQQVEIRNAVGVRPWRDDCPQAFVVGGDDLASREAAIAPLAELAEAKAIGLHAVEGVLGDRRVRGVLLYLKKPEAGTAELAKLVAKLGAAIGSSESTCSVPNVTRIL
jgi:hypothetical protein